MNTEILKKTYSKEFIYWLEKYIYSDIYNNFTIKNMRDGFINHPIELELYIKQIIKKYE